MKIEKILAFIWLIIAAVLIFLFISFIKNDGMLNFKFNSKHPSESLALCFDLYDDESYSTDQITEFNINLDSEAIFFEISENKDIKVEFYCDENHKPETSLNGTTLSIKSSRKHKHASKKHRKIVVYIPKDFIIDKLNIKVSSGSIYLTDCSINVFQSEISSGVINGKAKINEIHSVSSSGVTKLALLEPLTKDSSMSTSSGIIKLKIPSDSNLSIYHSVTSGIYNNKLQLDNKSNDADILGTGDVKLHLSATSGIIKINED
ncbi:MAG: DUF4097 family beta strand repeat protein [Treponema sp.]|nr:DUF4097 family beta strand repeat protein [Treponema sp.]